MSGGFFRGTSAEQDTRFSNKQAKLLKTQKFAPELEQLVDMTKVKIDVMRPWIANRVTELLGFEDEVLINFIYGLLEGKEVNGKEVQIQLTGFMEKHTAKFMKELWMLLLSAQKNASGVPQQFLDAKEEETKKKKLEADRIANEILKKKERESREIVQEKLRNMDGAVEMKVADDALDPNSKVLAKDEKEAGERNGVRGRNRVSRSPRSAAHSPSPHRGSPSRSVSKSHSNSRSYSSDRRKARSVSRSPKAQRRSFSPRRRSITPRRRRHSPWISRSPSRRSSYFRRRSRSSSPHRISSPIRHRRSPSPIRRRRSPSLVRRRRSPSPNRHHRSPSPIRRRRSPSPIRRRRSPSLIRRHRSPSLMRRHRSPSPVRRRRSPSPAQHRRSPSPVWRRRSPSPMRGRSLSATRHWSPSPVRHRSPSPVRRRYERSPLTRQRRSLSPGGYRSPVGRMRSPISSQRRSPSPYESSSRSPRYSSPPVVRRRSPNDSRRSPVHSPRAKNRTHKALSPVARHQSSSLRSQQRDQEDCKDSHKKESAFSASPERSPSVSESPPCLARKRSTSEDRRSFNPHESPVRRTRDQMVHNGSTSPSPRPRGRKPREDGPEISKEDRRNNCSSKDVDNKSLPLRGRSMRSSIVSKHEDVPVQVCNEKERSPGSEKMSGKGVRTGTSDQQRSTVYEDSLPNEREPSTYPGESRKADEWNRSHKNNGKDSDRRHKLENATMEVAKANQNNRSGTLESGSEESDKHRATKVKEKRKHKKYDKEEVASDDDYSSDSEIEKKEAKRRRKEEKKLRREEKRRRRDERRRRREERRAEKLKVKNQSDTDASDGEHVPRRDYHPSDNEETESAQKRLEMELRNKALESIKAKKNSSR